MKSGNLMITSFSQNKKEGIAYLYLKAHHALFSKCKQPNLGNWVTSAFCLIRSYSSHLAF